MGALILVLHTPLPPSLPRPPPGAISANPPAQGSARCAPLGDALLPHPDRTVKREVGGRPRTGEKLKKTLGSNLRASPTSTMVAVGLRCGLLLFLAFGCCTCLRLSPRAIRTSRSMRARHGRAALKADGDDADLGNFFATCAAHGSSRFACAESDDTHSLIVSTYNCTPPAWAASSRPTAILLRPLPTSWNMRGSRWTSKCQTKPWRALRLQTAKISSRNISHRKNPNSAGRSTVPQRRQRLMSGCCAKQHTRLRRRHLLTSWRPVASSSQPLAPASTLPHNSRGQRACLGLAGVSLLPERGQTTAAPGACAPWRGLWHEIWIRSERIVESMTAREIHPHKPVVIKPRTMIVPG